MTTVDVQSNSRDRPLGGNKFRTLVQVLHPAWVYKIPGTTPLPNRALQLTEVAFWTGSCRTDCTAQ